MKKASMFSLLFLAAATVFASAGYAGTLDLQITLNIYQVCDNSGNNCASAGNTGDLYFAAETDKIWAQAGINVLFNYVGKIDNSTWLNIDDTVTGDTFSDLAHYTSDYQSHTTVDVFLVDHIDVSAGGTTYGEGWQGAGGLVIAMTDVMAYGASGRLDTIAHELGHNLGLDPVTDSEYASGGHSNNPMELMASGSIRNTPTSLAGIAPDGTNYDQLSAYQIGVARDSSLLSPEPSTFALLAGGFALIAIRRRRK